MSWIITASEVESTQSLSLDDALITEGRRRTPKMKAQVKAAKKCADWMLKSLDGPANVNLSGFAATKDDDQPDQISVTVAAQGT